MLARGGSRNWRKGCVSSLCLSEWGHVFRADLGCIITALCHGRKPKILHNEIGSNNTHTLHR